MKREAYGARSSRSGASIRSWSLRRPTSSVRRWNASLAAHLSGSIIYSGSHSENLVGNGNQAGVVSYGVNINAQPGDLLDKPLGSPPTRLNSSFGPILYADNDRVGNYNGVTFDLRGRARGMFFDVSYTRSSSKDDADNYPTAINPHQFYGPSPWDAPHRLSLTANYTFPGTRPAAQ